MPPVALGHRRAPFGSEIRVHASGEAAHTDAVPGTKDEGLADIAELQAGAVTNRQLRAGGMSAKDVKVRLRRGTLRTTPARGVYRVAGAERTWRQDLWVALLAGPDGTLASHVSAAALRGPDRAAVNPARDCSSRWQRSIFAAPSCTTPPSAALTGVSMKESPRRHWAERWSTAQPYSPRRASTTSSTRPSEKVSADMRRRCRRGTVRVASGAVRVSQRRWRLMRLAPVLGAWGRPTFCGKSLTGVAPPLCEYDIYDEHGEWVATVDFAWPAWWFLLEYDGGPAHGPRRLHLDARRQEAIERIGWRLERADHHDARPSSHRLLDVLSPILSQPPPDGNVIHMPQAKRRKRFR